MSNQPKEISIVEVIEKRLEQGNRFLTSPGLDKRRVKIWHDLVADSLKKIYGSDSEVIQKFKNVADGAVLVSDPKVGLQELMVFTSRVLGALTDGVLASVQQPQISKSVSGLTKIFVGHGRNPVWSHVVAHLKDELGLDVEAFETSSRASEHIVDVLKGFLDVCDAAVIVMTADDRTLEGTTRARQNVIHEIGLFQGRYGFNRVILLQQTSTEDFSNIAGVQTVRFNERIEESFYDLDRAIRRL